MARMRAMLRQMEEVILGKVGDHGIIVIVWARRAAAKSIEHLRLGIGYRHDASRQQAGDEKSGFLHIGATLSTSS